MIEATAVDWTITGSEWAIVGFVVGMLLMVGLLAWVLHRHGQIMESHERGRAVQTELEALRAANRLNGEFWAAKEQLEAEARQQQSGGGQP